MPVLHSHEGGGDMVESIGGQAACMYASNVSAHVLETRADLKALQDLAGRALDHFREGRPLAEFARYTQELGLATDADVAYIESIPAKIQEEIGALIVGYLERDPRWTVLIDHEPADEFAVKTTEDEATRIATLILVGPHPE